MSEVAPVERGARHLLLHELRLQPERRLLIVVHPGPSNRAAEVLLEHTGRLLHIETSVLRVDQLTRMSDAGRAELVDALQQSDACVVLGGAGGANAESLERALRVPMMGRPCALIRFDPLAVLGARVTLGGALIGSEPDGSHQRLQRWLEKKLATSFQITLKDALGTQLDLELPGGKGDAQRAPALGSTHESRRAYPRLPAVAQVLDATGKLVAPEVYMPDGRADALFESRSFQFQAGALRGVVGPHGVAWMREAMAYVPGLRVHSIAFGTDSDIGTDDASRPARISQAGCVVTLIDPAVTLARPGDAPYRGISFCVAGPTLDVRIGGLPVIAQGEYTAAVRALAGA